MSNHTTLLKVSYTRPNTALALTPFRRVFQEFLKEPNVSLLLLSRCGFFSSHCFASPCLLPPSYVLLRHDGLDDRGSPGAGQKMRPTKARSTESEKIAGYVLFYLSSVGLKQ